MIREVKFESQDRRMKQILAALNKHGIKDIEEANQICESYGIDPYMECESTQMICFENAKWAYVVGTAIALKEKAKDAVEAAEYIGEGLQAFCIPGSVADDRKVGIGHGRLAARVSSALRWRSWPVLPRLTIEAPRRPSCRFRPPSTPRTSCPSGACSPSSRRRSRIPRPRRRACSGSCRSPRSGPAGRLGSGTQNHPRVCGKHEAVTSSWTWASRCCIGRHLRI